MNKNKSIIIFVILIFCSISLFSENNYCIEKLDFDKNDCVYDINKHVRNSAKNYIKKEELEEFSITSCNLLTLGKVKGCIVLVEFSEGKMPFRKDYLVELYYDELNNYRKSEILCFNNAPPNIKRFPIDIIPSPGTNCQFDNTNDF